jgi:hypothetical protein
VSDHSHFGEYADARHDHREYADDRHDHDLDYAGKHHQHSDLERQDETLRGALGEQASDLAASVARIRALEAANARLLAAFTSLSAGCTQVAITGEANGTRRAIAEELAAVFTALTGTFSGEPGTEVGQ